MPFVTIKLYPERSKFAQKARHVSFLYYTYIVDITYKNYDFSNWFCFRLDLGLTFQLVSMSKYDNLLKI